MSHDSSTVDTANAVRQLQILESNVVQEFQRVRQNAFQLFADTSKQLDNYFAAVSKRTGSALEKVVQATQQQKPAGRARVPGQSTLFDCGVKKSLKLSSGTVVNVDSAEIASKVCKAPSALALTCEGCHSTFSVQKALGSHKNHCSLFKAHERSRQQRLRLAANAAGVGCVRLSANPPELILMWNADRERREKEAAAAAAAADASDAKRRKDGKSDARILNKGSKKRHTYTYEEKADILQQVRIVPGKALHCLVE